jgi:hypothetical protein
MRRLLALLAPLLAVGCGPEGSDSGTGPSLPREGQPRPGARQAKEPDAPAVPAGQDFASEVRLLFRVAACGGEAQLPAGLEAKLAEEHCAWLLPRLEAYRAGDLERARTFFAELRPAGLPGSVVYPFGGGDLLTALLVYPDAAEITTLSTEPAGDPRGLGALEAKQWAAGLAALREAVDGMLGGEADAESLARLDKAGLPGPLALALLALRVHGLEPVALRYFRVEADGGLHYRSAADIATLEQAPQPGPDAVGRGASEAFAHAELQFRGAKGPARTYRHVGASLADRALNADERVLKHLAAKGRVAALAKASRYVLWNPGFSRIRGYLLDHAAFMVADSTGIPPRFARPAGLVQECYGRFGGPSQNANREIAQELAAFFAAQPQRELPFRFGYLDAEKQAHLLVTRRAPGEPDALPTAGPKPDPGPAQPRGPRRSPDAAPEREPTPSPTPTSTGAAAAGR